MSGSRVKVTELLAGYSFGGVVYGPFKASQDTPFLEVPAALAAALNLPLYSDETQASAEPAADLTEARDQIDLLTEKLHRANDRIAFLEGETKGKQAEWEKQRDGLLSDLAASLKREDALKAQLGEGQESGVPDNQPQHEQKPPEQPAGTPLPDSAPLRDLLIQHGFDTLEKLEKGLIVAEGQSESPVRQLDGVGAKSETALQALVADWKAKN